MLWYLASALACPVEAPAATLSPEDRLRVARERLDCAITSSTDVGYAWMELALVLEPSDYEGSIPAWRKVTELLAPGPDRSSAWLRVGLDRGLKGDFPGAFADLRMAVDEASPGAQRVDAQLWLARVLAKGGRPDEARTLLADVEPTTPEESEQLAVVHSLAWGQTMHARRDAGDLNGAVQAAFEALELVKHTDGTDRVMCELAYGQRLIEVGRPLQSIPHLELAQRAFAEGAAGSEGDLVASSSLARAYEAAERPLDALPLAQRGVDIAVGTFGPEHDEAGEALGHLAVVLRGLDRDEEANEAYRGALAVRTAALGPDHPEVLFLEHDVLSFDLSQGHAAAALAGVEALLPRWIRVRGPDHLDTLATTKLQCELLHAVGRFQEASGCSTRTRAALETLLGDHPMVVDALTAESLVLNDLGDPRASLERIRKALDVQARLEPDPSTVESLNLLLARSLVHLGQTTAAAEALGRTPPTNPANLPMWHIVHGELLVHAEPEAALAHFQLALDSNPSLPNRSAAASGQGFANLLLGRLNEAEASMNAALDAAVQQHGPHDPRNVEAMYNVAQVHLARNDEIAAVAMIDRIGVTLDGAGLHVHPTYALALASVGVLLVSEIPDDARRLVLEAVAMADSTLGPRHPDTASIRMSAAATLFELDDAAGALVFATEAVDVFTAVLGPLHRRTLQAKQSEASIRLQLGQAAEAKVLIDVIDQQITRLYGRHSQERVPLLTVRAGANAVLGNVDAARGDSELALDIEQELLRTVLASSERHRIAAVQRGQGPLGMYLRSEADPGRAYTRGLGWKGLASAAFLGSHEPNPELSDVRNQIAALAFSPPPAMGSLERRDALEALSKRKDALQAKVSTKRGETRWRKVCKRLPDDAAVVDFFWIQGFGTGAQRSTLQAYVLRGGDCNEVVRVELDGPAVVEAHKRYRRSIARRSIATDRMSAQLREVLWDPLEPALQGRTKVTVIPVASFADISFAGLPKADGTYLVQQVQLTTVTHLSELKSTEDPISMEASLVVGGVDYSREGPTPETSERSGCGWSAFGRLPGALQEADAVGATLGDLGELQQLTGADASEANVRAALANASIVHFATHGFHASDSCAWDALGGDTPLAGQLDTFSLVSGMNPMVLSGLALAGANDKGEKLGTDDGVFTAEEVAGVSMKADLVVLSACESGLGAVAPGEGVLGLQRGFQQAGAKHVVYSLWPVPDEATRDLMKAFYSGLAAGVPPAAALRDAQIQLLERNWETYDEGRPTDWAAFVLGG